MKNYMVGYRLPGSGLHMYEVKVQALTWNEAAAKAKAIVGYEDAIPTCDIEVIFAILDF